MAKFEHKYDVSLPYFTWGSSLSLRDTQSPRQEMGVYIGLTLQGENKWAQVFSDCSTAAVEPHPPTQASLPRLLSHSVRGREPLGPWPGLGAQGLGYRKKLSASYKHERFCTHDKLAPEGMLQRRRTVCVKLAACKKSRISHHRYSKLQASLLLVHQTTVRSPGCVWNWTRSLPSQSMN